MRISLVASLKDLIKKSPSVIQKLYYNLVPFSKRYGRVFNDTYEFLLESEKWSREDLEEYQLKEFKKLINHCYNNVPYYTKVALNIYDIKGNKIRTLIDDELDQGKISLNWDGVSNQGHLVSSGIYFVVLKVDNEKIISKVTMLK